MQDRSSFSPLIKVQLSTHHFQRNPEAFNKVANTSCTKFCPYLTKTVGNRTRFMKALKECIAFTSPIFTKPQILGSVLYPQLSRNMERVSTNLFAPLIKLRQSLGRFSRKKRGTAFCKRITIKNFSILLQRVFSLKIRHEKTIGGLKWSLHKTSFTS